MTDPKNSSQPERLHQPTKREVDFVIGLQLTTLVLLMVIAFLMCLVFRDFLKEKRLDSDQYQRFVVNRFFIFASFPSNSF